MRTHLMQRVLRVQWPLSVKDSARAPLKGQLHEWHCELSANGSHHTHTHTFKVELLAGTVCESDDVGRRSFASIVKRER